MGGGGGMMQLVLQLAGDACEHHVLRLDLAFRVKGFMSREVAFASSLSSVSLASVVWHLLSTPPSAFLDSCPVCPVPESVDLGSFFFGVGVGVLLLPAVEALILLRGLCLRRLAAAFHSPGYYRVICSGAP